jgi:hypothetical protein
VRAAAAAGDRIRRLGAFDTVSITLDAAPPGIPGSAVVVLVDVAEARGRAAGDFGVFANAITQVPIQLKMSPFVFTELMSCLHLASDQMFLRACEFSFLLRFTYLE